MDSEVVFINEMEEFLEICVNLTGQAEIDIPVIFATSNLSATGTVALRSHVNQYLKSFQL